MSQIQPLAQCPICLQQTLNTYITSACSHSFCKPCFILHLTTLINSNKRSLSDLKCPFQHCHTLISQQQLYNILDFPLFIKIRNRLIYSNIVLCPACSTINQFITSQTNWHCSSCDQSICKGCKSISYEGDCSDKSHYFNEVRGAFAKEEIGYCPGCETPFVKDNMCDHVSCGNENCGMEFCFACFVPFSPIKCHGWHYHREDCQNYEKREEGVEDKQMYDCFECQKMKKVMNREFDVCERSKISTEHFLMKLMRRMRGEEEEVGENEENEKSNE